MKKQIQHITKICKNQCTYNRGRPRQVAQSSVESSYDNKVDHQPLLWREEQRLFPLLVCQTVALQVSAENTEGVESGGRFQSTQKH